MGRAVPTHQAAIGVCFTEHTGAVRKNWRQTPLSRSFLEREQTEKGSRGQMWNQESGGCSLFFLDGGNDGLCFGAAETDTPQRERTMVSRNGSSSGEQCLSRWGVG